MQLLPVAAALLSSSEGMLGAASGTNLRGADSCTRATQSTSTVIYNILRARGGIISAALVGDRALRGLRGMQDITVGRGFRTLSDTFACQHRF